MVARCPWAESHLLLREYHDREWGVPVHDDRIHFEFLVLEGAQAGLSWLTVLKRRSAYRQAFAGFDPDRVAEYDAHQIEELLTDRGIIRNRQKIASAVNNAVEMIKIQRSFGSFDQYLWSFTQDRPVINHWQNQAEIPPTSSLSDKISRDLKGRGFKFVGSTIIYAHLQAVGIINDHLISCYRYIDIINSGLY